MMRRRDAGSATVEFVLVLPGLVLALGAVLGAGQWATEQARAEIAAGTAARVALVDSDAEAQSAGRRVAPGAEVAISRVGEAIEVTVTGPSAWGLPVRAEAYASGAAR